MIKAILFDCFGVLTSDNWREFLQQIPEPTRQQVRDVHMAYDRGFISYFDFRAKTLELTHATEQELNDIFIRRPNVPKNTQLLNYIASLHGRYKIGILSNAGSNWIRESLLSPNEQEYFDDIVLSFEVGVGKPDTAAFELACSRLHVDRHETVLVDDRQDYCQVAESLSMKTVLYTQFVQFKHDLEAILTDTNDQSAG